MRCSSAAGRCPDKTEVEKVLDGDIGEFIEAQKLL